MEDKRRLAWFISTRLFVVTIFLVSTIILEVKDPGSFGDQLLESLTKLIVVTYLFSISSLIALRATDRITLSVAYLQIIWDLCFVTVLILITGGISSPYSFLYTLSIINASVLLSRREALYTASLCGILFGSILDLQYYGKLVSIGLSPLPALQFGAGYIFYTIFVNIVAFYLTAFLTGYLAEQAKKSASELSRKVIDYEELKRQHTSIVQHLNIGLLTMTADARVRVFNPYAEDLTGISQADAYDRFLDEIFPCFKDVATPPYTNKKAEIEFQGPDKTNRILGCHSVPFTDVQEKVAGVIVNFQDLTHIRRMEEALKRADRLAAVGALAARIAHEIRNPLASISGSVQLIAQGKGIAPEDLKLLNIVTRETDRLDELIRDFLAYAHPGKPAKETVNFSSFLQDMLDLVALDQRFRNIALEQVCPDDLVLALDQGKMKQVFWNLLINAAEASPASGSIRVYVEILDQKEVGQMFGRTVKIELSDTGKGMSAEETSRVFEPFFSTKPGGTGLGLATVYRIIEAHGGTIFVESAIGMGTTFTILLPTE